MTSSTSPTRVATTGWPLASASRNTIGEASVRSDDAKFTGSRSLADKDETCVRHLLQYQSRRFHQNQLPFVRANHSHIDDQRHIRRDPELSAELCLVPIWMETREINRRTDYFDFFRSNSVISDELPLDHRCISDNAGAPVTINECAVRASDRIGNATRPGEGNTRPIQRQSEPMIFRAETFYQVDPMLPAKAPEAK